MKDWRSFFSWGNIFDVFHGAFSSFIVKRKKILQGTILAMMLSGFVYAGITRDPNKGAQLYIAESNFLFKPVIEDAIQEGQLRAKLVAPVMTWFIQSMEKATMESMDRTLQ